MYVVASGGGNALGNFQDLEDSMSGNSPTNAGGEVYYADGIIDQYTNRASINDVMDNIKNWNKGALLQQQQVGVLPKDGKSSVDPNIEGRSIRNAGKNYEFNNITFSLSAQESANIALNPNSAQILESMRKDYLDSIVSFVNSKHGINGSTALPAYIIADNFHTNTQNYHVQMRVSRYAIDDVNKVISKFDFDLSDSSIANEFQQYLSNRFSQPIIVQTSGAKTQQAINTQTQQIINTFQQTGASVQTVAIDPELHNIARAEAAMVEDQKRLEQKMIDLQNELEERSEAIKNIQHARAAITQKIEAEKERDDALSAKETAEQAAKDAIDEATAAIADANNKVVEAEEKVSAADERAAQAEDFSQKTLIINGQLKEKVEELEKSTTELNGIIEDITNERDEFEQLRNESVDREKALRAERDNLLTVTIPGLEKQIEDLNEQKAVLVTDLQGTVLTLNQTKDDLEKSQKAIAELSSEKTGLEAIVGNLETKITGMAQSMQILKDENQSYVSQLQESFKRREAQQQQLFDDEREALENQLKALKARAIKEAAEAVTQDRKAEPAPAIFEAHDQTKDYPVTEHALDGFDVYKTKDGKSVLYFDPATNKEAFRDTGKGITIVVQNEETIRAAMELAIAKWPDIAEKGIKVAKNQDPAFNDLIVRVAAKHGFKLQDEALQEQVDLLLAEKKESVKLDVLDSEMAGDDVKPAGETTAKPKSRLTPEQRAEAQKIFEDKPVDDGKGKDKDDKDR